MTTRILTEVSAGICELKNPMNAALSAHDETIDVLNKNEPLIVYK